MTKSVGRAMQHDRFQRLRGDDAGRALSRFPAWRNGKITIVVRRNPFAPRDIEHHHADAGASVRAIAQLAGVDPRSQPTICRCGGAWLLQRDWDRPVPTGHLVEFTVLPHGGDGQSTFRTALSLALVVGAAFAVPGLTSLLGSSGLGLTGNWLIAGVAASQVAIIAGGTVLINAVIPPGSELSSQAESPSPTYTLSSQSNVARLGQPIPVMYGRHLIYPDLGALPWTEFLTQRQYLYQLFVIGQGLYAIEQIRIGEVNLGNFPDISHEIVEPGDPITVMNPQVYQAREVGGQVLHAINDIDPGFVGPFPACPPGNTINLAEVDITFPNGLVLSDGSANSISVSIEGRRINDVGEAIESYWSLLDQIITDAAVTPRRFSLGVPLPSSGRWEIRMRRTDGLGDVGSGDTVEWTALKGFLQIPSIVDYGDVTMLATASRATDSLTRVTAQKWNVIAVRKLPILLALAGWTSNAVTTLGSSGGNWNGFTFVQRIEADYLGVTGEMLRVTFKAGTGEGGKILKAYVGHAASSGESYDFESTPTQLLFDGNAAVTIPAGQTAVGESSFVLEDGKALLIATYHDDASNDTFAFTTAAPLGWNYYFRSGDEAATVNKTSGYTAAGSGNASHVTRVEVFNDENVWSEPIATRSIAWAAADILRNTTYGAGLPDSMIDLQGLSALDAIWSARGDEFNGIFDQRTTIWEALTKVLKAGRATPYQQSGIVRFYRDHGQTLPVAMYALPNIVADSFSVEFMLPVAGETADGVEAEYFDDRIWRPLTIRAGVDDESPTDPAQEQLFGVTDADQAQREAEYIAAANRYRRAFVSFQTELDGLIPSRGDAILVAHDLPEWGESGEVISYDEGTLILTLGHEVRLEDGFDWFVWLRDVRGQASAQIAVSQDSIRVDQLILAEQPHYDDDDPFLIGSGERREPVYFALGRSSREPRLAIVTSVAPRGNAAVAIQAVLDDPRVHVN